MTDKSRIKKIISILQTEYADVQVALYYKTPFQLLAATILSAQCTDEVVNRVTPGLFKQYPDAVRLARAGQSDVERLVRQTGFFRNKAKNLIGMAQAIQTRFEGKVPQTMAELVTLPGVARKTANVVLGAAFHRLEGIVVDTHVQRLSFRLGLTQEKNPVKIEQALMTIIPHDLWHRFSLWLIFHGRRVCDARKPKCADCACQKLCPSAGIYLSG
ncbi:endonuclease III [bacterium]|nr:endonuclease III [bacterium]